MSLLIIIFIYITNLNWINFNFITKKINLRNQSDLLFV